MLKKIGHISALRNHFTSFSLDLNNVEIFNKLSVSGENYLCSVKTFHSCGILNKDLTKTYQARLVKLKHKLMDEEIENISVPVSRVTSFLPDKNLPTRLFNGIMYKDLPIVNIKVSPNNTIINLTDAKGYVKAIRSCGIEGFKNAKKGTNLAAQATALSFSRKIVDLGYKTVRVRIQGLGPGRASSVKGLSLGGLDVVSVTDNTHVSDTPARGKKLRRI